MKIPILVRLAERAKAEAAMSERRDGVPLGDLSEIDRKVLAAIELRLAEFVTQIEANSVLLTEIRNELRERATAPRRRSRRQPPSTERVKVRLHEELLVVLLEGGEALSTEELARRVNDRSRYVTRNGGAVSAEAVRSRISNGHYRHLFARERGLVALSPSGTQRVSHLLTSASHEPSISAGVGMVHGNQSSTAR